MKYWFLTYFFILIPHVTIILFLEIEIQLKLKNFIKSHMLLFHKNFALKIKICLKNEDSQSSDSQV